MTTEDIRIDTANGIGFIALDRPKALNALTPLMLRAISEALRAWRHDQAIRAVVVYSPHVRAFCAGGDIRFLYESAQAGARDAIDAFFTDEYKLNHAIFTFPKPYIAVVNGVVMGGGMGIAQGGPDCGLRIVTDRTKMAMPEVNIGLFPDVGGSHFLSHAPGQLGNYLGLTGLTIGAADALYVGLADVFVPGAELGGLNALIENTPGKELPAAIRAFAAPFAAQAGASELQAQRATIDAHFGAASVAAIMASLECDEHPFAQKALKAMRLRSPLMMCVTRELLVRGAAMDVADCLRMERNLVRRNFEHGEVLEGVRALVIDKDNAPAWNPATLEEVTGEMVERFFEPAWPAAAHPLRHLK